MPGACNVAIWLLCVCETSKRKGFFIFCFVFVWCQHDWTGPCSADLKDGLSDVDSLAKFSNFLSLLQHLQPLFMSSLSQELCFQQQNTLKWKLANVYSSVPACLKKFGRIHYGWEDFFSDGKHLLNCNVSVRDGQKKDEFSENFQTTFDPSLNFGKSCCKFFLQISKKSCVKVRNLQQKFWIEN